MSAKSTINLWMCLLLISCGPSLQSNTAHESVPRLEELKVSVQVPEKINPSPAAYHIESYVELIKGKKIAVVANQTSQVQGTHLVDTLLNLGVDIRHVYSPEHGFRGDLANGALVNDERDDRTGLVIYSLYGKNKKPSAASLKDIDAVLFDIQDIGVRCYTYISTLHYLMQACAEQGVEVIVLDRPNPWGNTIDGPVLEKGYHSFVGMHPVPLIYGMTIGEYALMINGEEWLEGGKKAVLRVIPCHDYRHQDEYILPIPPSPNLPTQTSIYLYPSLALFEGTVVSVGRGTDRPFQLVGHPDFKQGSVEFTPAPNKGSSDPPLNGQKCFGRFYAPQKGDSIHNAKQVDISILKDFYIDLSPKMKFFLESGFFDKLAGNGIYRKQIVEGLSEKEIRSTWQVDIENFRSIRARYLLYQD